MRFLKVEATGGFPTAEPNYRHLERYINIYGVDEVQDEVVKDDDSNLAPSDPRTYTKTGRVHVHAHHEEEGRSYYVLKDTTAAEFVAILEAAIEADRRLVAPAPVPVPARAKLGYATTADNLAVVAVSLPRPLSDFSKIEFAGKSGATPAAAFALADPFVRTVEVAEIPINDRALPPPPVLVVTAQTGNINVGRSADGTKLYFVGDDAAKAFGIDVTGIE